MYQYKPNKQSKQLFIEAMEKITVFCKENNIHHSLSYDSYYFTLHGIDYRISNHKPKKQTDLHCITAGKTRIITIYNDLCNGYTLNKRGERSNELLP